VPTADLVLSRFPRHLDADQPGKLIGDVVGGLARPLDSQISQVGKVRRSHRSGEAEQRIDVLRLAALHGFDDLFLVPVVRRLAALAALDAVADPEPVLDLLGLDEDTGLPRRPGEADDSAARERLEAAVGAAGVHDAWLAVARRSLTAAIADQRQRATTAAGLLGAAADYLGLDAIEVHHASAAPGAVAFWHLARCRDRITPALARGDDPAAIAPVAGEHLVALEENPPYLADLAPTPRRHGDHFHVKRQGFETVPCTVIVEGIDDRTVAPMLVDTIRGTGIATTISVPAGSTLRFERDGRVELDGVSVAGRCYVLRGAVFAGAAEALDAFVFADATADDDTNALRYGDRAGRYTVTSPLATAFDPSPPFPHLDALLVPMQLDRSITRFAAFVGVGVFASLTAGGDADPAAPEPVAGYFDESVFLPDPAGPRSLAIGFEWDEREAYAVRVWLPFAFTRLDVASDEKGEPTLREVVRRLLDRHRAAGVHVYVEHADPRWVLGTGIARDLDSDDALGLVVAGTETWTDDTAQPDP
jgi:hypothetical protein